MSNQIFVGNISWDTTESDLKDLFAQFGDVITAQIMMDRETQKPRGFGFVTMGSPDAARSAIEALSGRELHGRKLTVNEAHPKEGGGGGDFGGRNRNRTQHARQGGRGGGDSFSAR
jgi:RNA recognition motif-containing protein